jgi:hypothetical protein
VRLCGITPPDAKALVIATPRCVATIFTAVFDGIAAGTSDRIRTSMSVRTLNFGQDEVRNPGDAASKLLRRFQGAEAVRASGEVCLLGGWEAE